LRQIISFAVFEELDKESVSLYILMIINCWYYQSDNHGNCHRLLCWERATWRSGITNWLRSIFCWQEWLPEQWKELI